MQVHIGRGPGPAKPGAALAASSHGSTAQHPQPATPPSPEPPDAEAPPPGEADAVPAEAAPDPGPEAEAEADPAPEPEPAPAPGGHSEAEWAKLAKVRLGIAKVNGALDPELVRKGVRSNIGQLRTCYAKGLLGSPELGGKLTLEFEIDKKGKTDAAKVASSTVADDALGACFADAIAGWKFDAPEDGKTVEVKQSFTLSL